MKKNIEIIKGERRYVSVIVQRKDGESFSITSGQFEARDYEGEEILPLQSVTGIEDVSTPTATRYRVNALVTFSQDAPHTVFVYFWIAVDDKLLGQKVKVLVHG